MHIFRVTYNLGGRMNRMMVLGLLLVLVSCGPSVDRLVDLESGMTKKEVIKLLGKPESINRHNYDDNVVIDSWYYRLNDHDGYKSCQQWLYFKNGILFSWDEGQPQQHRYQIEVK